MFDPSGNGALLLDGNGNVATASVSDSFGNTVSTGGNVYSAFLGQGGQWGYYQDAEDGLTLLGHRFYDRSTGRFLTRDPIGYRGGVNLYAYTGNDPVNRADPSGFDGFTAGFFGGLVGIGIAVIITGGIFIVPVLIGGVLGGAAGGYFFGTGPNHGGDAVEGAIGGGVLACIVILHQRPPLLPPGAPPAEPEPPDPNQWPPAPTTPEL